MKKTLKSILALALSAALCLSVAGCSQSSSTTSTNSAVNSTANAITDSSSQANSKPVAQVVMKVSVGVADTHFEAIAVNKMKEYVEEKTSGTLKMEIFPSAQIGNDQEVFEGLKLGVAQMLPCGVDIISNFSKNFGLLSLPYLFDNEEQVKEVTQGEFGQAILADLDKIGYVGLGFGNFGFRHITNNKHPIKSVSDLKGLKIRTMTTPIHLEVFEALGANPTPMAFSELFSALQQGVVDGQENPLMNIYSNKLNEVQNYLTLDGHVYSLVAFVVSKDWYNKLDPSHQEALHEGIAIAQQYMAEACTSEDELALTKMKEAGMEVVELSEGEKDEFRQATEAVREKYGNSINPERYHQLLDAIAATK